jgi:hypothetical protein
MRVAYRCGVWVHVVALKGHKPLGPHQSPSWRLKFRPPVATTAPSNDVGTAGEEHNTITSCLNCRCCAQITTITAGSSVCYRDCGVPSVARTKVLCTAQDLFSQKNAGPNSTVLILIRRDGYVDRLMSGHVRSVVAYTVMLQVTWSQALM